MRHLPLGQSRFGVGRRVPKLCVEAVGLSASFGRPIESPSPPHDALGVSLRRIAVENPEGHVQAQLFHPLGGFLLLFKQGMGDEVGHLEQVVVLGASE